MNIGIDIDGVLFPWADAANEAVMDKFGIPNPGPHAKWEHLRGKITSDQWAWLWGAEGSDEVFGRVGLVYPGVVPAFNALIKNQEHRCHFVTHRDPRRTALHTAEFLTRHFGGHPWAGVHVLQNSIPKHSLMEWDVFIDDKPETVLEMLTHTQAVVFSPKRPWNTELADIRHPRFLHYSDPQVVGDVVQAW
jgi:hypothetical protein